MLCPIVVDSRHVLKLALEVTQQCPLQHNYSKARAKILADVPARNAELSSKLSEDETEITSFDLFGSIFPEPPAERFASLSESQLEELVSLRHSKKKKEVTNWSVSGLLP